MDNAERYHVEQLERAVEISRANLDELTPDQYVRLKQQMHKFIFETELGGTESGMMLHFPVEKIREEFPKALKAKLGKMIPDEFVRPIVANLKSSLNSIASNQDYFVLEAKVTDARLNASVENKSSPFVLHWRLAPVEGAALALLLHLAGSGLTADKVRHCPREECGNVFILARYARTDRKRYCSTKCAQYAATRRYREKRKRKTRKEKL